jgi:hypothetical protein
LHHLILESSVESKCPIINCGFNDLAKQRVADIRVQQVGLIVALDKFPFQITQVLFCGIQKKGFSDRNDYSGAEGIEDVRATPILFLDLRNCEDGTNGPVVVGTNGPVVVDLVCKVSTAGGGGGIGGGGIGCGGIGVCNRKEVA